MLWRALFLLPVVGGLTFLAHVGSEPQRGQYKGDRYFSQSDNDCERGQLTIIRKDGSYGILCPLAHTSVKADIAGFGAHVTVTQSFRNPTQTPIEAVYAFPLPDNAAIDHMTMHIGDRVIQGVIKQRDEARRIYDVAKNQGQAAALLDQERPNIFTQHVANITPGAQVDIEIEYVQTLKYDGGSFEFNFPMTVGPRYLGHTADPGKVSPPITPKGTRTGTTIDLSVNLDAGARVEGVNSVLHRITSNKIDDNRYRLVLTKEDEIPNRDFILRYQVANSSLSDVFVGHMDRTKGGFFGMALLPPRMVATEDVTPREFIFVIDRSGSQEGFPIEKSRELALKLVDTMRPKDTFNVISFAEDTTNLWPSPRPNTPENLKQAKIFLNAIQAGGGTELRQGLLASLNETKDPERMRIIVFNTDGFIGNEKEVLDSIKNSRGNARVFTFGIGNSVNRYLIDAMSNEGRGESEIVTLSDQADEAVKRFVRRMRTPVLTDISVDVNGEKLTDVEPKTMPDLYDQQPVYVYGRYSQPGPATVTISGRRAGMAWSRSMQVVLPSNDQHEQIMSMWARDRVDSLTHKSYVEHFSNDNIDLTNQITDTALEFGILSDYTSFVAVEDRIVNVGGHERRVHVPVEMADGVNYDTTVGTLSNMGIQQTLGVNVNGLSSRPVGTGRGGYGGGGGMGGAVIAGRTPTAQSGLNAPAGVAKSISLQPLKDDEARAKAKPENKIAKPLRDAKGVVEVQIWVTSLTPDVLKALEKAGAKVEDKDEKVGVAFATIDASKILAVAKLDAVTRIERLED